MHKYLTLVLLIVFASQASSKIVDLRNMSDADGALREISICARPSPGGAGLPGHAFVAFARTDSSGGLTFRTLGHTVFKISDAILSYNSLIPATDAALVSEKYTAIKQECLTVQVNADQFQSAYAQASQPLAKLGIKFDEGKPVQKTYSLGVEDCITFAVGIVKRFADRGLKIPERKATDLPLAYVRKLIDAN